MKAIITIIMAIMLLAVSGHAAEMVTATIEVDVDWSSGKEITNPDGTTYWTGARAIIPSARCFDSDESDCLKGTKDGVNFGGFSGWLNLPEVEAGKLSTALVQIKTTTGKLVKMSAKKKLDNETYKYLIQTYRQADEKAPPLVLDGVSLEK